METTGDIREKSFTGCTNGRLQREDFYWVWRVQETLGTRFSMGVGAGDRRDNSFAVVETGYFI